MYVVAMRLDLRIRDAHSLKDKRRHLKSLLAELHKDFPAVGMAEVDYQDLWQRTAIGLAAVAGQFGHLQRLLHTIETKLRASSDFELLEIATSYLERPQ